MSAHETDPPDDVEAATVADAPGSADQTLPTDAVPAGSPVSRRPFVAGGLAGVWALLVGLAVVACVVMLTWAISPNSAGDSAAAWSAVGIVWLGAHLVPLTVSGEPVSLLPIGGLLLGLLLTRRSGAWTGRLLPEPSTGEALRIVIGAGLVYAAGGAGVAWVSGGSAASAALGPAALITGLVAAVGTVWGIAPEAGLVAKARNRVSDALWRTVMAGLAAAVGLFSAGALVVTASLIGSFAAMATMLADLESGPVGAAGVTLLGALSLPNLDIWAMSVVVGPGFDVGGIGALSAFGGEVGVLPALPAMAAIPTTVPAWTPVLLLVPLGFGVLAGRIRWGRDLPTPTGVLASGAGLAAVVGLTVSGMVLLSSGSLGDQLLADVGPPVVPVALAAIGLVLLGFLGEAGWQAARLAWDLHRAERAASALAPDVSAVSVREVPVAATDPSEDLGEPVDPGAPGEGSSTRSRRRWSAVPGLVGTAGAAVLGRARDTDRGAPVAPGLEDSVEAPDDGLDLREPQVDVRDETGAGEPALGDSAGADPDPPAQAQTG